MKTTAKWISGNQFVIDNDKHLRLAVTDHYSSDEIDPTCLDLIMMGFAGCITDEFRSTGASGR